MTSGSESTPENPKATQEDGQSIASPAKPRRAAAAPQAKKEDATAPAGYITVRELSAKRRKTVDEMLTQGSTFEDTLEAVKGSGEARITLGAIEFYFRSNLKLQQNRVRWLTKTARKVKQACADPNSAQSEVADVVIMQGLLGVRRGVPSSDLQSAVRAKDQEENQQLKAKAYRLKDERHRYDLLMMKARLRSEIARHEVLTHKIVDLKRQAEREASDGSLSPEMIRRIQEVYGLVSAAP